MSREKILVCCITLRVSLANIFQKIHWGHARMQIRYLLACIKCSIHLFLNITVFNIIVFKFLPLTLAALRPSFGANSDPQIVELWPII